MLGNFGAETVTPDIPDADAWAAAPVVIANAPRLDPHSVTLGPWEARVHRRIG